MRRIAACGIVLALCSGCGAAHHAAPPTAKKLRGLAPAGVERKPAFTLTDTAGRAYALQTATRGKLVYLYFGYTHCPDACPLAMATLAAALRHQPAATRKQVAVVFVTVDPRRDTGPVLRRWLDKYDRRFVGLRGPEQQIVAAERAAHVPIAPPVKQANGNYTVDHAALVLTYSPDGRTHAVYPNGFAARDYAHDLPVLLGYDGR